jgi:hypothetical protein
MNQHRSEARMNVEIGPLRPEHSRRFAELNREWLTKYNLVEPSDEEQLLIRTELTHLRLPNSL